MAVRSSTLLFKKASTNAMHISVECSARVYTLRNIAARAINMSTVYAAVQDAPHTRIEAVIFVIGR